MSVPAAALEQSIEAEIRRLQGDETPPEETPPEETPPESEEPEEEVPEGEGPDETEEAEEEEEESPRVAAAPAGKPAKKSRENDAIRELRRRAQEAEDRAARLEAQRAQEDAARQQREAQEAIRREDAEVAALPAEEQGSARQNLFNKRAAGELMRLNRQNADMQDRETFRTNSDADPTLKAIAPMVENIAQQFIRAGHTVNRDTIADNVLGRLYRTTQGREQLNRLLAMQTKPKAKKRIPAGRASGGSKGSPKRSAEDMDRAALMKRIGNKPI